MGRFIDFILGREEPPQTQPPTSAARDSLPSPVGMIGFPSFGGLIFDVTPESSAALSAVYRALDVISNGVAQCSFREMRGNLELPTSRLLRRPHPDMGRREWVNLVVNSMALYDVAYLLKVGMDAEGVPMGLVPLDPSTVAPITTDFYTSVLPQKFSIAGQTEIDRTDLVILRRNPIPGIAIQQSGVINLARTSLAAYIAANNYMSRFWQGGGSQRMVLETDAELDESQAIQIQDRWRSARMRGPDYTPVLDYGVKVRDIGADPLSDSAQEARNWQVAEVGRYFGVHSSLLGAPSGDSETYTSTEQQGLDFVKYTLQAYIGELEEKISDLLPGGRRLVVDPTPLYKGTLISQAQALQLATGGKPWMTQDEAREAWNLPPVENSNDIAPIAKAAVAATPREDN